MQINNTDFATKSQKGLLLVTDVTNLSAILSALFTPYSKLFVVINV